MAFDLRRSERRIKPQRSRTKLTPRADADLPLLTAAGSGRPLLLDTCVYIDGLKARLPPIADELLNSRSLNHSATVLGELTHALGRLDPADPRTQAALKPIRAAIEAVPDHRLVAPSTAVLAEAGMLSGLVCRLTHRTPEIALFNDAVVFLQARERGWSVLTGNLKDFDLFDQLLPGSEPVFYRCD